MKRGTSIPARLRRLAVTFMAGQALAGCYSSTNICEMSLGTIRPLEEEYCAGLMGCPYCDCILAPETPGCDIDQLDADWVAGCFEEPGRADFAQACIDGDPECEPFIQTLIDLGCVSSL